MNQVLTFQMKDSFNRPLHLYAIFTALCAFCLLIAGGLVTSTGSGLAVPDWPLSYGMIMPPMIGGILYEHSHRLVASLVGILTIVLTVWLWRKENRPWLRRLGIVALSAVIVQGLLGGVTVRYLLPTGVSVIHATLAQTFFCILVSIALFTSRWWMQHSTAEGSHKNLSAFLPLSVATVAVIYIQLILGALMRHTHSGLAVPDFPLMYGQLFPSLSPESLKAYNDRLISLDIQTATDTPVAAGQILIHVLHRVWAMVVAGTIIYSSARLFQMGREQKRVKVLAFTLIGLTVLQLTLGAMSVLTQKAVEITTAHVVVGALLLATSVLIFLHVYRLAGMGVPLLLPSTIKEEAVA
jgi:cytochrome c oxidase assembly protein subunit 15